MKINEIIRENRKKQKLTQEQLAAYLGVSAPAVNKWEKGNSYPDITLLPTLARTLHIDLNTLLSFQEDLTPSEVAAFLNDLSILIKKEGFEIGWQTAMQKILEFPNCCNLLLSTALALGGALLLYPPKQDADYEVQLEQLFVRASKSSDFSIRSQAESMLISKYMERKEFDRAQALLNQLPDKLLPDKQLLQINLYYQQRDYKKAAELSERKILSAVSELQPSLSTLTNIALEENREEDAAFIADISKSTARLYGLWEYGSYTAHIELYLAQKNTKKFLEALAQILNAALSPWDLSASPLYRHIKHRGNLNTLGNEACRSLISAIEKNANGAFDFLEGNEELAKLLKEWKRNGSLTIAEYTPASNHQCGT